MILLDFSPISIAAIMMAIKKDNEILTPKLVLHMTLNSIRMYNVKFRRTHGEMVICCDTDRNWRKRKFEYYKASRKESHKKSDVDWNIVYDGLNLVKKQIQEDFPYKILEVDGAEADDIIGVLAKKATDDKKDTIIVSNDKDFYQLHSDYVSQYRPINKTILQYDDPEIRLKEHIIRGDVDDGIPNIKSDDNTFVTEGKRQKRMMKADIPMMLEWSIDDFKEANLDYNYYRNELLINLDNVPSHIKEKILFDYSLPVEKNKPKMVKFFMKYKLGYLYSKINDFF